MTETFSSNSISVSFAGTISALKCFMNTFNWTLDHAILQTCFIEISQNSQENTRARVSFLIKLKALGLQFIKKETLAQVFSYNFCKISKIPFFT